ncbi:unnamed protein product [Microthlaspi erraticum]|uniref:RNase H type-1 domain-containing protein n=1 Tax=Microthlaspi erraticum TaxID=1685480 RepID=A0A6D2KYL8_9BRAS|nr:unnamed protein product [Microthlaspi erraticum]
MKVSDQALELFPWIIWQIWKARNTKVFDDKDIDPIDTYQLAYAETQAWLAAQTLEEMTEEHTYTELGLSQEESLPVYPRCQTDASWGVDSPFMGTGFIIEKEEGDCIYGASSMHQVMSPLHAEFAALLWAMKVSLELGHTSLHFETDCLQLVSIIEEEEDWPSLASELDEFFFIRASYTCFTLSFIPRLLNVRADCLSKGARARDSICTHVDTSIPNWVAHQPLLFG